MNWQIHIIAISGWRLDFQQPYIIYGWVDHDGIKIHLLCFGKHDFEYGNDDLNPKIYLWVQKQGLFRTEAWLLDDVFEVNSS